MTLTMKIIRQNETMGSADCIPWGRSHSAMSLVKAAIVVFAIMPFSSANVGAAETATRYDGPMLNFTVGQAQIFDSGSQPVRYGVEYRGHSRTYWHIIPAVGFAMADSGASYLYSDLRHDFWLGDRWTLIPSFGVGLFDDSGQIRLGNTIEFRSGIEAA